MAFFDADDAHHAAVTSAIEDEPGPFIVSPYVIAELDYLLASQRGTRAELAALAELTDGAWTLPDFAVEDLREASDVVARYADQAIGIADASLVVLAHRYRTERLLSLDHRHFRVVRTLSGGTFTLLP